MDRFHLIRGVFGGSDVYDSAGNKVGYSLPSIIGDGEVLYDNDGNYVGQSFESIFGGEAFSGIGAYGYMDDEILMGRNAWLHGDPFKKEQNDEFGLNPSGFNHEDEDKDVNDDYLSGKDYFDDVDDSDRDDGSDFDFDIGYDDW